MADLLLSLREIPRSPG